jgi:hypothetical protein
MFYGIDSPHTCEFLLARVFVYLETTITRIDGDTILYFETRVHHVLTMKHPFLGTIPLYRMY